MLDIKDHYGNGCPSTSAMQSVDPDYNTYCLFGEGIAHMDTLRDVTICEGCKNRLNAFISRYSG